MTTAALSVIVGVTVYVIGQLMSQFVIAPVAAQREQIGIIADLLIYLANRYGNPGTMSKSENDEAQLRPRRGVNPQSA